jgi:UDP-GlcNAc:undecaprenyl-phosphate GlcNAc-1-phosphate transferase
VSLLIALGLGLMLTPAAIRLGVAVGLLDRPVSPLKIHDSPVPALGGVAVMIAAVLGASLAGARIGTGLLGAIALLTVAGLVDDIRPLTPAVQLALQIGAGLLLVAGGSRLGWLQPLDGIAVVACVLVCVNGLNMIDGQDGLAAGVAAIAAGGLAVAGGSPGVLAALAGALIAFLVWNRPPARIFLGNSGPGPVAVILVAALGGLSEAHGLRGALAGAACLGVPLLEVGFTVARRLGSGRLTDGDRSHSYDLLALALGSRARATVSFWVIAAVMAGIGALVANVRVQAGIPIVASSAVVAGLAVWRLWARVGLPAEVAPVDVRPGGAF